MAAILIHMLLQLDITSVPLDVLRSRITLLPQDAALFSGTLRQNIDPFDEYSVSWLNPHQPETALTFRSLG